MLRSIRRAVLVYHANSSLICKYSVQSPAPQHSAPFEYDRNIVYTHDTHVYCIYLEREYLRVCVLFVKLQQFTNLETRETRRYSLHCILYGLPFDVM